jgi:hypothetical protein
VTLLSMKIAVVKAVAFLPVLAAGAETAAGVITDRWSPLINLGAVGCVLAWFMFRMEPRLRRMEQAIDRMSRAIMLAALSMKGVSPALKEQATAVLKEIEDAQERREQP